MLLYSYVDRRENGENHHKLGCGGFAKKFSLTIVSSNKVDPKLARNGTC